MAGFTMPKKGEGAAMLRDLRDEERPAREDAPTRGRQEDELTPVLTEARNPVLTEARPDASPSGIADSSADVLKQGNKQVRPQARKTVRKASRPRGSKDGMADGRTEGGNFLDVVDAALASREPLVGGVKATVDMSPKLSSRAKRYLADHRGQNTRQVLIALFDAFLTEKGY